MRRHAWLGPVLLTLVVLAWLCLDSYLEVPLTAARAACPSPHLCGQTAPRMWQAL